MKKSKLIKSVFICLCIILFHQNIEAQFKVRPVKGNDPGSGLCYTIDGLNFVINSIPIELDEGYTGDPIEILGIHLETVAYDLGTPDTSGPKDEYPSNLILLSDNDEPKGTSIISGPFDVPSIFNPSTLGNITGVLHPSFPISDINNIVFVVNIVENQIQDYTEFYNQCSLGLGLLEGANRAKDADESVSFFPNPIGNDRNVTVTQKKSSEDSYYKVYDINGKYVEEFVIAKGVTKFRVDFRDLLSGIYIIRSNNKSISRKIIIY